jgi:DNA-binding response OmpR family regulator
MMKRLLVIEVDKADFEAIETMLKPGRYDFVWTPNAHRGLQIADEERFELAFLDVDVPDMNPWVALRFLNSLHPFLPVIMLAETVGDHLRAVTRGADASFGKPIDPGELRRTVKRLLEQPHPKRLKKNGVASLDINFDQTEAQFEKKPFED